MFLLILNFYRSYNATEKMEALLPPHPHAV